ncbi:MAG: MATE family efflux transporter [Alphaproteobacteria bacterium]|nr:MATE family efflux transporter [Alphaproteobacteria bacterium]
MKNMTQGNPTKLILLFSLPLLIGNIFQQLYNISDILIVGRLLGVNALAALGSTAPLYFVFLLISFGFTGGLTVITAQKFGAKNYDLMRKSMTHCVYASTVLSVLIMSFLLSFLHPFLILMNVPEVILEDSYNFMAVLTGGMVMIVFYNLLSGFIRAVGDSKTPLYFLIFSTVLNVIFNFILIYYAKLGVVGSALGTVSAITIAVILCLMYMYKKFPIMRLKKSDWKYDKGFMKEHLAVAIPMALQFSVLSLSFMIIQSVCNSFGPDVIAAFTAALRIEQLATQPLLALGIALATYSAQNWGAGKLARIRKGVRISALISLSIAVCISLLVRFVGSSMISIFIKDESPIIIEIGKDYLRISTFFYFFLGMIFVFRNTLQGMGKPLIPLIGSCVELAVRSFAAIYLAKVIGYKGIFYAGPIAWVGASLVVMLGYAVVIYHLKASKTKNYYLMNKHRIGLCSSITGSNQTPAAE